jgi:AcrR family transcriptional regulator
MARVVNVQEYAVKRREILDAAQRLVYTRGYERMAIQDILDDLQISKGAFYHYFDSKQAVLEAVIERMIDEVEQLLIPIVHDSHLPALEKLQRFFAASSRYKTAQKPFLLALLRIWYTDDNALVRHKVNTIGIKRVKPLLTTIIHQGIQEGTLATLYPDQIGDIVLSLGQSLSDALAEIFLSLEPDRDELGRVESTVAAYTDALERVLGAPSGSLSLVDVETLKEWFLSARDDA